MHGRQHPAPKLCAQMMGGAVQSGAREFNMVRRTIKF
jgi:hypothetical protein